MESRLSYDGRGTDLRRYLRAVIRLWPLLLIFALLAAVSGFLYSIWLERNPTYQATAVVAMGRPRYVLNLDSRVDTEKLAQAGLTDGSLTTLAMSDEVLYQVLEKVNQAFPNAGLTLGTLRPMLTVTVSKDVQLVTLQVRGEIPALVTEVANAWAPAFVVEANRLYGLSDVLAFFEAQVARAKEELDRAQQSKVAFEASNDLTALETEHAALKSAHQQYLAEKQRLQALLQDVDLLQSQLDAQTHTRPMTATLNSEDQAAVLGLVLKSQDANVKTSIPASIGGLSVQTGRTLEEGLAILTTLREGLQTKLANLDAQIAGVAPALASLQERMEIARGKKKELETAVTLAEETYNLALGGLEEARIMEADTASRARVASSATLPTSPLRPPRRLQNTLLAAALGLAVGAVIALLLEYLAEGRQPAATGERSLARETTSE
ncbi:MAG: hypothetical protein QHJ81_15590 [Anaerolineae bacterium]|nr:hypothetical protein [Anaerolineae bacterium]